MAGITEQIKTDDWKNEKHVPVIECPDEVKADDTFFVTAGVGKEVAHPNTTEHHIRWVDLYFKPADGKLPFHVARVEFTAHGEAVSGPNEGPVYTQHTACACLRISKPGAFYATAYCNIHGLWESAKAITVVK